MEKIAGETPKDIANGLAEKPKEKPDDHKLVRTK